MHRQHRLSRFSGLPRLGLLASTLTLAALLAAPAAAQRRSSNDWQIGVGRRTGHSEIGVSIGSRGVQINAGYRERHRQPVLQPCPPPPPAGRWETRHERVWVPGAVHRVWVPPVFETRYDYRGCPYQVQVRCGFWDTIQEQGYWEHRDTRVWVPYYGRAITAH